MVSRKRRKSRHKKAVFVAQKLKLLTLGIILVLFFLGGVRKLTLAWKNGWDYHHQENLFIVDGERSYLLILSPESKEVKSWSFPKTWQLDVFGGLGRYWAKGVAKFALEEGSGQILGNTLMMELGLPIDLWIYNEHPSCPGDKNTKECLISAVWRSGFLGRASLSKGGKVDFFKTAFFLRRSGNWQMFDVGDEGLLENISEREGAGMALKKKSWDELSLKFFIDPLIRNEAIPLGVYNFSDQPGVAKTIARILTNAGVTVVAVSNRRQEGIDPCLITVKNAGLKDKFIFKKLLAVFNCRFQLRPLDEFSDLTDINVYFGADWAPLD